MEQIGCYRWCFLGIGSTLEVQILNDGFDKLQLSQHDGSVVLFLHLYSQKVADVALVIDSESLGASMQVGDHPVDGLIIRAKNNAVVDVYKEHDRPTVTEASVKFAWRKADFMHALVHVFVPYTASLFLAIHIAYQLESMCFLVI